jgi:hypothetical protein
MPIDFRASQIQTNKIISSGSTGTSTGARLVVYPHVADDGTSPNQGFINQSVFVTSSIGTDIFLYVSGGIGERNVGGAQSITCFGGDVHISGNLTVGGTSPSGGGGSNFFWSPSNPFIEASGSLAITGSGYFKGGLSGSLQQVAPGVPYLLAGPNIIIATNSLGQVSITGSASGGGGGSSFYRLEVLDYYSTNATADTTAGQVIFPANQFTGSIVLYGVIANSSATATGSVRLYNVTSGSYVDIGGVGNQYLSVSGTTPTIVSSVDLISASNFNSSSQAIYELQVSSSNGASYGFFGGFELRPSGSFTGISYITSSTYYTYVSGTWEDGGNKLATTSSVAIAGNLGTGYFADAVGADVYFFVSGSSGSKDSATPGVAVFGGDVVISGVLHGGSPLKIGSPAKFFQGLSGSITALTDGSPLFIGVGGVSISTNSLGQIAITSSVGGNSLQDAYNGGSAVELVTASGSMTLSGNIGFGNSLLKLVPTQATEPALDVMNNYTSNGDPANTLNMVHIHGVDSLFGGAGIQLRANGSFTSYIGFKNGTSSPLNSSNPPEAKLYYHEGDKKLILVSGQGSAGTTVIEDGGAYGGELLTAKNAANSGEGTINLLPSKPNGYVINSGSLEQSGSASFKNKVEVTGSLSVSGSGGSNGTFSQYNGLRYYPKIVTTLPYTASLNDYIVAVSASTGDGVALPSTSEFGRTFIVKDVSGSAGQNLLTITAASGELIDGSPSATIAIDYGSAKFVYFGSGIGWGVV